jgi:hypothetical protein
MKDDSGDVIKLNEILLAGFKQIATLTLLLIFRRIPPIWTKLPLMVSVLLAGLRWITRLYRKKPAARKQKAPTRQKSVPAHTSAAARPKEELSPAKKLITLDAADKFGKAKTFIQQLNGQEFSTEVGEALPVLAKNYFPFRLDDTDKGVKFFLD